jgi:DNA topoisomerase IA
VALQKLASDKLRMASDDTMKLAEELYNKGFISYPRTGVSVDFILHSDTCCASQRLTVFKRALI